MRAALLLGALCLAAPEAAAQTDSTASGAVVVVDSSRVRSPRAAVTRALILPGLGQVYNREWVKAPVATGLVAGAVVYAVYRQRRYRLYQNAAFYAGCVESPNREACTDAADIEAAMDEWIETGEPSGAEARSIRDGFRGQRDIGFLVVGVAYALQALDAYVAAELSGFDVSEDLSLHVAPTPRGAALSLRVEL